MATPTEGRRSAAGRPRPSGVPKLRAAAFEDFDDLVEIFRGLDRYHAELWPDFFLERSRTIAYFHGLMIDDDARLVVVEEGGELLGAAIGRVYDAPEDPIIAPLRRVHVAALVVRPDHRRRGLGRALMDAIATWGAEQGAEQLVLTVWAGNEGAQALYDALDYHEVNRVLVKDLPRGGL
ncbi:MAG: GNAT family N-acetyltransferase [Deltaproteobacteria bacterium]|nr:GNAT family N-acetyltransferase [Deltaproteobacteria bacterium]